MMKGVEFANPENLKEVTERQMAKIIKSDRSNNDASQAARKEMDKLPMAQRNDCKQTLKRLLKHNTEAHESAAKAGKELMALLEYLPISIWLEVADATTRLLVYVQEPEVVEIVRESQAVVEKKRPLEGEIAIHTIVIEQNLSNMVNLKEEWGYQKDDVGRKTVAAIVYKYLKEVMFPQAHVTTTYLAEKFAAKESMLHKYIVGMKYKGGGASGTMNKVSEDWTRTQQEENRDANVEEARELDLTREELPMMKGTEKKLGRKRDVTEIRGELSKPKKKRQRNEDDDDEEEDEDRQGAGKAPVTKRNCHQKLEKWERNGRKSAETWSHLENSHMNQELKQNRKYGAKNNTRNND